MKIRLSYFATTAAIVAILSPLSGCSGSSGDDDDNNSGSTAEGTGTSGPGSGGGDPGGTGTGGATSASSSASGTGGGGSQIEASFATVRQVFVGAHCADSSCHNGEAKPTLQDSTMQDDDTLYTILTTYVSEACGNIPIVTPGDPERSALVKILNGPCGEIGRMPNGCVSEPVTEYSCLDPAYIDAIERWVAAGAPR
ncbi:hypothetical protein [Sorangium sp. So ce131]|uniref:hypothetical protein n=1 Tax=Sorangium sp. So ce131 TaxID=3133282 RepID=UPI003F5DFE3A